MEIFVFPLASSSFRFAVPPTFRQVSLANILEPIFLRQCRVEAEEEPRKACSTFVERADVLQSWLWDFLME